MGLLIFLLIIILFILVSLIIFQNNNFNTIHFNYFGWEKKIPPLFKECFEKFKTINSVFTLEVHGSETEKIVMKHPSLYSVYKNSVRRVMKADIARLVLIYEFGGFYMDLDVEPYVSFQKLLELFPSKKVFVFTETSKEKDERGNIRGQNARGDRREQSPLMTKGNTRIANYAFGSVKKHPFIKLCFELIVDRYLEYSPVNIL